MRKGSITLSIDSRLEDVCFLSSAVRSICEEIALNEMESYQVETCVVEAVNNAILHAYGETQGDDVTVVIGIAEDRLVFEVYDHGKPMDHEPEEPPDPTCADPTEIQENGWGWKIIRSWMDEVEYTVGENENVLRLEKKIRPVRKTPKHVRNGLRGPGKNIGVEESGER